MSDDTDPTDEIIRQAAFWAAELATDEICDRGLEAYEAWRREDPRHSVAMERMRGFHSRLAKAAAPERAALDRLIAQRRAPKTGTVWVMVALMLGGTAWMASQSWAVRSYFPDQHTAIGEQSQVALADGQLTLDTNSAADLSVSDGVSHVRLFEGRVLAKVAPHLGRPFQIETREGTATALGTAFIVERHDDVTVVTVTQSRVKACALGNERCITLSPGQSAALANGRVSPRPSIDPRSAAAWAEGWLIADNRPVIDVLRELNRYRLAAILFDPVPLREVRVSGSFPVSDTDRALRGLADAKGLAISTSAAGTRIDRK